jgi:TrmH family RNA methyltransferase
MEPITSTSNTRVKLVTALQSRARTRRKEGLIVLDGVRLIADAYHNGFVPEFVLYTPGAADDLVAEMATDSVDTAPVDDAVMAHMSETQTPQGVVAVFQTPERALPESLGRVLILDAITDPGNAGTLVRTAAGAGCDAVIFAPGSVDAYNPKVLRAGMGAHFRVVVAELDWTAIRALGLPRVILADGDAETAYDAVDWRARWALVIGNEAHGATDDARELATDAVVIPMAQATESLNAAMAAAVILFEAARQRRVSG